MLREPTEKEVQIFARIRRLRDDKQGYLKTLKSDNPKFRVIRKDIEAFSVTLGILREIYNFLPVIEFENKLRKAHDKQN